jgi:eukaryotic-like serine/threonine-protein kinase
VASVEPARTYFCPRCGTHRDHAGACDRDGTALAAVSLGSLLGTEVGNYVLVQLLGEGGMGSVYRAVQPAIGAEVAIKVLHPSPGSSPSRFLLEAQAVNRVRHPSLIRILDTGTLPDARPYLVMELLDGLSFADTVGKLSPALACFVTCEALDALEVVHVGGIIHRDLKPANIFLTRDGRVVVLDFGIAKLVGTDASLTKTGSGLLGTPDYMAPEQIRSLALDRRTDVYAAGVMLYEAITGHRPFAAAATFDMLVQHLERAPTSPREWVPALPSALDEAILRALEKDPARRFQTAHEMAAALRAAIGTTSTRTELAAFVGMHAAAPRPVATPPAVLDTVPDPPTAATKQERPRSRPPARRWPIGVAIGLGVAAAAIVWTMAHDRGGASMPTTVPAIAVPAPDAGVVEVTDADVSLALPADAAIPVHPMHSKPHLPVVTHDAGSADVGHPRKDNPYLQ